MPRVHISMPRANAHGLSYNPIILPSSRTTNIIVLSRSSSSTSIIIIEAPSIVPSQPRSQYYPQVLHEHHGSVPPVLATDGDGHGQRGDGTVTTLVDRFHEDRDDLVRHLVGTTSHRALDLRSNISLVLFSVAIVVVVVAPFSGRIQQRPFYQVGQSGEFRNVSRATVEVAHVQWRQRVGVCKSPFGVRGGAVFVAEGDELKVYGCIVEVC
mmetsp:Transcript_29638/g.61862  ORF Transcript_29638/g.61862 Transcript_29638/m.61862 type:complete len:211 (+) Transcript_29638:230-862(+)